MSLTSVCAVSTLKSYVRAYVLRIVALHANTRSDLTIVAATQWLFRKSEKFLNTARRNVASLVTGEGLEPPTFSMSTKRSSQLS